MGLPALKYEDLPHYTYEDYVQWEGRWEMIRGVPFAMTPSPRKKHQIISTNLAFQLISRLKGCHNDCLVYEAMDWQITDDTVVRPDVVVSCGDDGDDRKLEISPVLVVEILSPSTKKKDRGIKYQLYQAAGVKYYCIVDSELESVEVFEYRADEYAKKDAEEKARGITFHINGCSIVLDVDQIFSLQERG